MKNTLTLDEPLGFGKYQGLSVAAIARFDPGYLLWLNQNVERLKWSEEALGVAKKAWSADVRQKLENQNAWAWGFGRDVRAANQRRAMERIRIQMEERSRARMRHA